MYAYFKKYNSKKVILLYPKYNPTDENMLYYYEPDNDLIVFFVDLENMEESLLELIMA